MNQYGYQFLYSFIPKLTYIECSFVVDSANGNGLGIRSLKGRGVSAVYMHTSSTPAAGNPNPASGNILVQFQSNYNRYLNGQSGFVAPLTGSNITISASSVMTAHQAYVITALGTSTTADWVAAGVPANIPPAPGVPFVAAGTGSFGSGSGTVKAVGSSGIDSIEVVGDPNQTIIQPGQPYMLLQCLQDGVLTAPADNSVAGMCFWFRDSSVSNGSGE